MNNNSVRMPEHFHHNSIAMCEKLYDLYAEYIEADDSVNFPALRLKHLSLPLEFRFETIKEIQCACLNALHSQELLRSDLARILSDYKTLEKMDHPSVFGNGTSPNDAGKLFFDFYDNILKLKLVSDTARDKLYALTSEIESLTEDLDLYLSECSEQADKMDELSDCFETLLEELMN